MKIRKISDEEAVKLISEGKEAMIVDVCKCGHERLEHEGMFNEGKCSKCDCERFTFAYWGIEEIEEV